MKCVRDHTHKMDTPYKHRIQLKEANYMYLYVHVHYSLLLHWIYIPRSVFNLWVT